MKKILIVILVLIAVLLIIGQIRRHLGGNGGEKLVDVDFPSDCRAVAGPYTRTPATGDGPFVHTFAYSSTAAPEGPNHLPICIIGAPANVNTGDTVVWTSDKPFQVALAQGPSPNAACKLAAFQQPPDAGCATSHTANLPIYYGAACDYEVTFSSCDHKLTGDPHLRVCTLVNQSDQNFFFRYLWPQHQQTVTVRC